MPQSRPSTIHRAERHFEKEKQTGNNSFKLQSQVGQAVGPYAMPPRNHGRWSFASEERSLDRAPCRPTGAPAKLLHQTSRRPDETKISMTLAPWGPASTFPPRVLRPIARKLDRQLANEKTPIGSPFTGSLGSPCNHDRNGEQTAARLPDAARQRQMHPPIGRLQGAKHYVGPLRS